MSMQFIAFLFDFLGKLKADCVLKFRTVCGIIGEENRLRLRVQKHFNENNEIIKQRQYENGYANLLYERIKGSGNE